MLIYNAIITGILATAIFDLYQISLSYAYNISKPKWNLIGRFFYGLIERKFFRENIEDENVIKNELIVGYFFHYLIGVIFGFLYISINSIFFIEPSLLIAILIGFITVLGAWCVLMPFAFNVGFFGSKIENKYKVLLQNLIAHFIFGNGLFIGYSIIY